MIASNTVIVISVSGGKDSTAIADIGLERFGPGRCELVFADTGNEHAITLDHIHGYRTQVEAGALMIESMRRDAERYRWLRNRDLYARYYGVVVETTPDNIVINGKELDNAIDAAMGVVVGAK